MKIVQSMSSLKLFQHLRMLLSNLIMHERLGHVDCVVWVLRSGRYMWGIGEVRKKRNGNPSFHVVTFQEQ